MSQPTLQEYINKALDAQYQKTAGKMLAQIKAVSSAPNSQMQKALSDLNEEVLRLEQDEKPITQDNPALKQALLAYGAVLTTAATLIKANDNAIQESGQIIAVPSITAKVFSAVTNSILESNLDPMSPQAQAILAKAIKNSGVKWNGSVKSAIDFATNYVESDAWVAKMEGWGSGYHALTKNTLLQGMQNGWSPKYTADVLTQHATNIPYSAAETLTRTLQVTSYRDASLAMESVNGGMIEYKIRIASLSPTTCLSCIALHGTRLEVGERVDDHYNGECSEFYVVPGGGMPEFMQADSLPGSRQFLPFMDGNTWFASLSPERQAQQAAFQSSPAKLRAYRNGVPLSQFIGDHEDSVFGNQKIELSLIQALGIDANQYYSTNQ